MSTTGEFQRASSLHEFVPRVIHRVQLTSEKELELAASHREYKRREEERQETARVLAQRREHYESWEKVLLVGADSWERTRRMRDFVHELEAGSGPESADFLAWAGEYISWLDPVQRFEPPEGDVPELTHEEKSRLHRLPAPGPFDLWGT